ncbi:LCCL domain-containing protein [Humitalea sp. 24SJ18S-53]|uniref:LCCL domain-containing protein n=1 Tax=Humitalea sp. 24SJ18S-53 TaxID=3422307 RepID=UPI003D67A1FE
MTLNPPDQNGHLSRLRNQSVLMELIVDGTRHPFRMQVDVGPAGPILETSVPSEHPIFQSLADGRNVVLAGPGGSVTMPLTRSGLVIRQWANACNAQVASPQPRAPNAVASAPQAAPVAPTRPAVQPPGNGDRNVFGGGMDGKQQSAPGKPPSPAPASGNLRGDQPPAAAGQQSPPPARQQAPAATAQPSQPPARPSPAAQRVQPTQDPSRLCPDDVGDSRTSFMCSCTADMTARGVVHGSNPYAGGYPTTSICRAAVHAGAIDMSGGVIGVRGVDPFTSWFGASTRNGVQSSPDSNARASRAFRIDRVDQPAGPSVQERIRQHPLRRLMDEQCAQGEGAERIATCLIAAYRAQTFGDEFSRGLDVGFVSQVMADYRSGEKTCFAYMDLLRRSLHSVTTAGYPLPSGMVDCRTIGEIITSMIGFPSVIGSCARPERHGFEHMEACFASLATYRRNAIGAPPTHFIQRITAGLDQATIRRAQGDYASFVNQAPQQAFDEALFLSLRAGFEFCTSSRRLDPREPRLGMLNRYGSLVNSAVEFQNEAQFDNAVRQWAEQVTCADIMRLAAKLGAVSEQEARPYLDRAMANDAARCAPTRPGGAPTPEEVRESGDRLAARAMCRADTLEGALRGRMAGLSMRVAQDVCQINVMGNFNAFSLDYRFVPQTCRNAGPGLSQCAGTVQSACSSNLDGMGDAACAAATWQSQGVMEYRYDAPTCTWVPTNLQEQRSTRVPWSGRR